MWLRVLTGRRAGKVVPIVGGEFVIGSERGCDLVLPDRGVAARHAVLRVLPDGGHSLEDLGAPDGTFVAGRRIHAPVDLLGSEELCFGYTFANLSPRPAPRRKARVPLAVGVAAVVGIGVIGTLVGVLLPRTGGGSASEASQLAAQVEPVRAERTAPDAPAAVAPAVETTGPATGETSVEIVARPSVVRDDFSDPTSGWEVFEGDAATGAYEEGTYVIRISELGFYATADSGVPAERPVVSMTVHNVGRAASAGFGVVCRYQDEEHFLVLAAGTDGTTAVLRRTEDELSVISGGGEWTTSPNVPVNAPSYRLRADCRGSRVTLFVDGRRVVSARAEFEPGRVGLFAAGRVELRFDDVAIVDRRAG